MPAAAAAIFEGAMLAMARRIKRMEMTMGG